MTLYKEHIQINKRFQTSINLGLDLNSEEKIHEYIPTTDICDVLKRYIAVMLGNSKDYATTLVGPYGKGKSFLLLVLSYLTGQRRRDDVYEELIMKIKDVDSELYEMIQTLVKKDLRMMIVLVNSNYNDLNQAFLLALNQALTSENMTDIIPTTAFEICLDLIKKWETNPVEQQFTLEKCLEINHINLKQLKIGLSEYSLKAYKQFEKLYNCVSIGLSFNPLVNNDIVKTYSEVNHKICENGYSGMFIIFDEFSKFLESAGSGLMKELKIVQDMAELCARSSIHEQLHLCCVTHKSLDLYSTTNGNMSFKTIEGRFKEIKFNRSLDENYQMIATAIHKENYDEFIHQYIEDHKDFYERVQKSQPFENNQDFNTLFEGCFPLNPMTVFALIQLSELVAQNERTLFTFLSDTDDNSFNSFIQKTEEGSKLFNVDKIYDYFSPLLRKEESNNIRNIWYRTESVLSKVEDPVKKEVIKVLSVILMINDVNRFASNIDNIALALELSNEEVKTLVNELIKDHYLRKSQLTNLLSFGSTNSKEIEEQISLIKRIKSKNFSAENVLEEVDEKKYFLPRKYNEQNKITRFFRNVYLTEDQYMKLKSFSTLKEGMTSDGLVVNVLKQKCSKEEIFGRCDEINDPSVIVKVPANSLEPVFFDLISRFAALKVLKHDRNDDEIVNGEIELLLEEVKEDVGKMLEQNYYEDFEFHSSILVEKSFNDLLSNVMKTVFSKHLVFNYELVNKTTVSSQYQKSLNNVIDWILNGSDKAKFTYSETSPEQSVLSSIVEQIPSQEDAMQIIVEIREMILSSEGKKLSVQKLYEKYLNPPYGLRKGLVPLFIAKAISELSDNVILYFKGLEIDLNASNITKAVNYKGEYSISVAKGSREQNAYLRDMLQVFNEKPTGNFRQDTKVLCEKYREFFVGLPSLVRYCKSMDDYLSIPPEVLDYRDQFMSFDLNPYECVYTKALRYFRTESFMEVEAGLTLFVNTWRETVKDYKDQIVTFLKSVFSINKETSLRMGMNDVLTEIVGDDSVILSDDDMRVYQAITKLSYENFEAVDQLSVAIFRTHIEDWNFNRIDEMIKRMTEFLSSVKSAKKVDVSSTTIHDIINVSSDIETTPMGELMKNSLETVFEEFGESVSPEEKISILAAMMNKLM